MESNIAIFVRNTEWGHVLAEFYALMKRLGNVEQANEMIEEMKKAPEHKKNAFKYNLELLIGLNNKFK